MMKSLATCGGGIAPGGSDQRGWQRDRMTGDNGIWRARDRENNSFSRGKPTDVDPTLNVNIVHALSKSGAIVHQNVTKQVSNTSSTFFFSL